MDLASGLTNLELMGKGRAPLGPDKIPLNLHHSLQTMESPLIEMTHTMHKQNHGILHIWPNAASKKHGLPTTTSRVEVLPEINRSEFNKWRAEYWKSRAESMLSGNK